LNINKGCKKRTKGTRNWL